MTIPTKFYIHETVRCVSTPTIPIVGWVLTGLHRTGVEKAIEAVDKVRAGTVPEVEYGHNDSCYHVTREAVRVWDDVRDEEGAIISLDDWEDCLRRFDAWRKTS